ncbi:MAG: tRNA pseudouridine(55) synthase TruB, partial [Duncaniella sp.]|nr:tRNA pseudouridine(55) synthase TruB [Duncaniella sp.]
VTGRATKRIEELQAGVKEYVATIQLGATTPSFDLETEIDAVHPAEHITMDLIEEILPRFRGRIEQVPPSFSACKVDGKRAYNMARKGHDVQLKPKVLVIDAIDIVEFDSEKKALTLRIVCSKGTYIRALARDIGEALGSGGHLTALRRTRVGEARIEDCLSVEQAVELIRTTELEFPEGEQQVADA